jgi:heme o synthase
MKLPNKPYQILFKFTRLYLSLAISFSALAGYIIYSHRFNLTAWYAFLGVLFLSGAASALNQYQERHWDALMKRTQNRPIPSGQLNVRAAMLVIVLLALTGTGLLFFCSPMAAGLGLFNIIWYNGVYTPLKRRSPYVVLIGSITGSIPPMMGWTAAGGYIFDPGILFIAFFMFLWQVPHFWLLLLRFGKEYEDAGFPSISTVINEKLFQRIIFLWVLGTSISTLFFPLFHIILSPYIIVSLLILNLFLIWVFYKNIYGKRFVFNLSSAFRSLYLYQVLILVLLMIEALK